MAGIACNQDYEELDVIVNEMSKTPSDNSPLGETRSSPFGKIDFQSNGKGLLALDLPDEESLSTAFVDLSFRDYIGGASSSRAHLQDSYFGANFGGKNYDSSTPLNCSSSYATLMKYNSVFYEGSKMQNIPLYMLNAPVNSSKTRRLAEVPVSESSLVDQLYNAQYEMMHPSAMMRHDVEPKMHSHSRNILGQQNLHQPELSFREPYRMNSQVNGNCHSIHSNKYYNGYNSELLISRDEPCGVQYGDRLRNHLSDQAFSGSYIPRIRGMYTQRIFDLAKEQSGCMFLQHVLSDGIPQQIENIFLEIISNIVELMIDPFGNYMVQNLLEKCNENQKARVVYEITKVPGQLLSISCDVHGTRAVQKVIETIKRNHILMSRVMSALKPGLLNLMMDGNGSHVIQRCLQHMDPEYTMFILETALAHCFDLAKNRQGCCVLQKCIYHSTEKMKYQFVQNITANTLILAEDPYANYVIQFIIEMKVPRMTNHIVNQLDSHFVVLSMQKYSTNVVEKCLKLGGEANCERIIRELILKPNEFLDICLDQFGNYVIQSAIGSSKGAIRAALVDAIRLHALELRNSSYGRRVLTRIGMKNK